MREFAPTSINLHTHQHHLPRLKCDWEALPANHHLARSKCKSLATTTLPPALRVTEEIRAHHHPPTCDSSDGGELRPHHLHLLRVGGNYYPPLMIRVMQGRGWAVVPIPNNWCVFNLLYCTYN